MTDFMNLLPIFPDIPVGEYFVYLINWLVNNFPWLFESIRIIILFSTNSIYNVLSSVPPIILSLFLLVLLLKLNGIKTVLVSSIFIILIFSMNLWDSALQTLSLIIVSSIISISFGIPLGILKARLNYIEVLIDSILDFMQTLPSLTYLIPTVILFGIGKASGVVSTVIF
ncbi:MAG: proline/glycine betaine ABC transporter permease, partial [Candidatus Aenigmatarchaeota archaeon]